MTFKAWLKKDLHEATSTPTRRVLLWAALMLVIIVVGFLGNGMNTAG